MQEAEQALGKVVAIGIANSIPGVQLPFNPGVTHFWSDSKISGPYAICLRQIAKQTMQAKVCTYTVEHTSRKGGTPTNGSTKVRLPGASPMLLAH